MEEDASSLTSMSRASLRRINNDSSWLLTLPTDESFASSSFNLLIDPWLDESSQIDYHPSFSEQKRTTPAIATSIAGLEAILKDEQAGDTSLAANKPPSRQIDAILLSHPFTDHTHPQTLKDGSIPDRIPYYVTEDSKGAFQKLVGGRRVIVISSADCHIAPGFLTTSEKAKGLQEKSDSLPSNICILRVQTREKFGILSGATGLAWPKLHGAILILWKPPDGTSYHSILYTPHGTSSTSMPIWLQDDKIQHEAIMTSLDKIVLPNWLSGPVNLGLPAAMESIKQGTYLAKRILATHDERKEAKGLVASLIKRYWLGSSSPDARHDGLSELKKRDADRQKKAQEMIDTTLEDVGKRATAHVLVVNQILPL